MSCFCADPVGRSCDQTKVAITANQNIVLSLFTILQWLLRDPMRSTIFEKLLRLLAYVIGSCICLGAALASVGLLYNQENAFKAGLYLFLALAGMSGGFYFYFRALRVLSARRRVLSYPAAHRPKP